jgi:hypothetical protein
MTRKTGKALLKARQQMRAARLARAKRELIAAGVSLKLKRPPAKVVREKEKELRELYLELFPEEAAKEERPVEEAPPVVVGEPGEGEGPPSEKRVGAMTPTVEEKPPEEQAPAGGIEKQEPAEERPAEEEQIPVEEKPSEEPTEAEKQFAEEERASAENLSGKTSLSEKQPREEVKGSETEQPESE